MRVKVMLLILVLITPMVFSGILGDVTQDGKVNIIDALYIARTYVGIPVPVFDKTVADVTCDGKITIVDALHVARYYVGIYKVLGPCKTAPTPAPTAIVCEDPGTRLDFDNNKVKIVFDGIHWKIIEENKIILNINRGKIEEDTMLALRIIKHYNMDSKYTIGMPQDPPMMYFLPNGKLPEGSYSNEDAIAIDPDDARLEEMDGYWMLVEGRDILLEFEQDLESAQKALCIIKKYRPDYICYVGRPNPSMIYFRKAGSDKPTPEPQSTPNPTPIPNQTPQPKVINDREPDGKVTPKITPVATPNPLKTPKN